MEIPNWFDWTSNNFRDVLMPLAGQELNCLQIGAYSGDASRWLLDNVLTNPKSILHDVDPWIVSWGDDFDVDFKNVESIYDNKVLSFNNVVKYKMTSDEFFAQNTEKFDFIYIDGDHHRDPVARDAENALKASKVGTIIAFDDYLWDVMPEPENKPYDAINEFLKNHSDRLSLIINGYQLWVKVIK